MSEQHPTLREAWREYWSKRGPKRKCALYAYNAFSPTPAEFDELSLTDTLFMLVRVRYMRFYYVSFVWAENGIVCFQRDVRAYEFWRQPTGESLSEATRKRLESAGRKIDGGVCVLGWTRISAAAAGMHYQQPQMQQPRLSVVKGGVE